MALLTVSLIVVAGLSSYLVLPRMEDPILTQRVALVNTRYPGANAERVEALVTEPIEEVLREIEEIHLIRSTSRSGNSTVAIELADAVTEPDEIWSRVRDRLADVEPELPSTALAPDFERMDMKAFALIMALVWDADTKPNYAILRRQAERLEELLLGIAGTARRQRRLDGR